MHYSGLRQFTFRTPRRSRPGCSGVIDVSPAVFSFFSLDFLNFAARFRNPAPFFRLGKQSLKINVWVL